MNPNETQELMDTIKYIRDNFDMTVLLIEHDMRLCGRNMRKTDRAQLRSGACQRRNLRRSFKPRSNHRIFRRIGGENHGNA